jgi:hypothetical protein
VFYTHPRTTGKYLWLKKNAYIYDNNFIRAVVKLIVRYGSEDRDGKGESWSECCENSVIADYTGRQIIFGMPPFFILIHSNNNPGHIWRIKPLVVFLHHKWSGSSVG